VSTLSKFKPQTLSTTLPQKVALLFIHLLGMLQSLAILSAEKANFSVLIEPFSSRPNHANSSAEWNPRRKRISWRVTCVIRLTPHHWRSLSFEIA
jgi:hypothetical protein